jgi:hypothetical protein
VRRRSGFRPPDVIVGTSGNDHIDARGGDDIICGGGGRDTLLGGGGAGEDTVTGASGNDHLYGDAGTDHCVGGAGADLCDGGAPHYATPGADPDICSTDAEKHISSKEKEAGGYSGFASGTVTYDNGLVETWTAKVDMPTFGTDYYVGTTTITWAVSGTDDNGCTFTGANTYAGTAQLSILSWDDRYGIQLGSARGTPVKVTMSCPVTGTQHVDFWPLNADISSAHDMLVPDDIFEIIGSKTYRPASAPHVVASWKWDVEQWA